MNEEQELRARIKQDRTRLEALDWLKDRLYPGPHPNGCPSQDDTGHPAPCDCGYSEKTRLYEFIRTAIIKA